MISDLQQYKRKTLLKEKPWRRYIEGVNANLPTGGLIQRFAWLFRNKIDPSEYELYLDLMEKDYQENEGRKTDAF